MLRNTTLAVLAVLGLAASVQAGVIITRADEPTPGLAGFQTVTLTATSDVPGENLLAMDWAGDPDNNDPATGRGFFGPLNQVQPLGMATPYEDLNGFMTQPKQDSQFKLATSTAAIPGGVAEDLPTRLQGIWAWNTSPGLSYAFAQLVIPEAQTATVSYRGVISVDRGGAPTGVDVAGNVVVGGGGGVAPVVVDPINIGNRIRGNVVTHMFQTSAGTPPITWAVDGGAGPGPVGNAPTIDPNTGAFSWNSGLAGAFGTYTFTATATNSSGSDAGILTVNIIIPEPATITMLGLAMVGLVGFGARKRS